MSEDRIYGVIIEHKTEQPLVMEGPLQTLDEAWARMSKLAASPDIIRAAMFKAIHCRGNETLIPPESLP